MEDKLLDLDGIAEYLGVAATTPPQWRQRTRKGEMDPPLPEPDEPFPNKPLWRASTIRAWAMASDPPRWPPGAAARPDARTRGIHEGQHEPGRAA